MNRDITQRHSGQPTKSEKWGIGILIALALMIRLYGIGYRLPFKYGSTEIHVIPIALGFGSGSLTPTHYNFPPLFAYVVSFFFGLYFRKIYLILLKIFKIGEVSVLSLKTRLLRGLKCFKFVGFRIISLFGVIK